VPAFSLWTGVSLAIVIDASKILTEWELYIETAMIWKVLGTAAEPQVTVLM
jgi:hypothetical protein